MANETFQRTQSREVKGTGHFTRAVRGVEDTAVQWLWFALPINPERLGYGAGPLTWIRRWKHKKLRRRIHICLLDYHPKGGRQSRFTEFWINERSRLCSASMNERIEDADVVWVYCKDPIPPNNKEGLLRVLKRARPGAPIINHPEVYNAYHEEGTFEKLAEAGVSVPRSALTDKEIGKTLVVYKTKKGHGHTPKFLSEYNDSKVGYRAFEFIDSRGLDGLYRRYRAFYILGTVRPGTLLSSDRWNVLVKTAKRQEAFTMTSNEVNQIRLIAKTLDLQYFAVDYLRRKGDNLPVFIDLNVYPDVHSRLKQTSRKLGYYGHWHSLEARTRLAISEPLARPFWESFDEVMCAFASSKAAPGEPHDSGD